MQLFKEVLPLRAASREIVRELGFLQESFTVASVSHQHSHALMEVERFGELSLNELAAGLKLDKSTTSRILTQLLEKELVKVRANPEDKRGKIISLTKKGLAQLEKIHVNANERVQSALGMLSLEQRNTALEGIRLYSKALRVSRLLSQYEIRKIEKQDSTGVAQLIRKVMPEFGANGPGFAINDPEMSDMYSTYKQPGHVYFVITDGERILGGGGIAPLQGGKKGVCELRKMYFLPELRGLGLGQAVMDQCLAAAKEMGHKECYLETCKNMHQAQSLYRKNGFEQLCNPMGATGHFGCDMWFSRKL